MRRGVLLNNQMQPHAYPRKKNKKKKHDTKPCKTKINPPFSPLAPMLNPILKHQDSPGYPVLNYDDDPNDPKPCEILSWHKSVQVSIALSGNWQLLY